VDFWRSAFDLEYVLGLLPHGEDHPSLLPQELIDELRDREGPDGVVHFHTARKRRFGPGTNVRVKRGALMGFSGVVDQFAGEDRLKVLFDLLGRKTTVSPREAEVTAA